MPTTAFTDLVTPMVATWLNEVDRGTHRQISVLSGTGDAIIAANGPASLTAIVLGSNFFFFPIAPNTGATTINIKGLGAQPIRKSGNIALAAGDLATGVNAIIFYDGTQFQLLNPQTNMPASPVAIAQGGTGQTTAPLARTALSAAASGANSDITSLAGLTTPLSLSQGGTGANTQAAALTAINPTISFKAVASAATALATGVFTTVAFGTVNFNNGAFFAANAWTPSAGRPVLLTACVNVIATAASVGVITIAIFKNGVEFCRGVQQSVSAATGYGCVVSVVDVPNGTDVYTVRAFQNNAASINTSATPEQVVFSGVRL